jgi:hypothetical protein
MASRSRRGRGVDAKGRSKRSGGFVMLDYGLLDAEAWRALSPAARAVYIQLVRRYNGANNGTIAYSVREAVTECRVSINTALKAFDILESVGFVDCVTGSGFNRKDRQAREWRLTAFLCDRTRAPASRRFKGWRPPGDSNQITEARPEKIRTQTRSAALTDSNEITAPPEIARSDSKEITVETISGPTTDSNQITHIHLATGPPRNSSAQDADDISWML